MSGELDIRSIHRAHAAAHPDRLAVVDARREMTFEALDREIDRLAASLPGQAGMQAETPVVSMMESCVEYVASWFVLFRVGARAVHVSYRATPKELAYHLEDSSAGLVIGSKGRAS